MEDPRGKSHVNRALLPLVDHNLNTTKYVITNSRAEHSDNRGIGQLSLAMLGFWSVNGIFRLGTGSLGLCHHFSIRKSLSSLFLCLLNQSAMVCSHACFSWIPPASANILLSVLHPKGTAPSYLSTPNIFLWLQTEKGAATKETKNGDEERRSLWWSVILWYVICQMLFILCANCTFHGLG